MKIVIEIPEEEYDRVKRGSGWTNLSYYLECIKNGTPLPAGHGKLIAEPTEEEIAKTIGGNNGFAECIREAVKAVFDNAQTIIPAER